MLIYAYVNCTLLQAFTLRFHASLVMRSKLLILPLTLPYAPLGPALQFNIVLRLENPFLVKNPGLAFLGKPARRYHNPHVFHSSPASRGRSIRSQGSERRSKRR